jgi:hypothetical protein
MHLDESKEINEDAPTCSAGASSSTSGPVTMYDPALGKRRKFSSFLLKRKKVMEQNGISFVKGDAQDD